MGTAVGFRRLTGRFQSGFGPNRAYTKWLQELRRQGFDFDDIRAPHRAAAVRQLGKIGARTSGGAGLYHSGNIAQSLIGGVRLTFETQYIGWERMDWEVWSSIQLLHSPGTYGPYQRDFHGTETNDYEDAPDEPVVWTEALTPLDILNILDTRYYIHNPRIRLRTRATNAAGTTQWNETNFTIDNLTFSRVHE